MFSTKAEAIDWLNTYLPTNTKNEWLDPIQKGLTVLPYHHKKYWYIGRSEEWMNQVEDLAEKHCYAK